MCSAFISKVRYPHIVLLTATVVGGTAGCARPQGALFASRSAGPVWPAPPEAARIRFLGSIRGSDDLHSAQSARESFRAFLRGPRPSIRFVSPHAVAVSDHGRVAVADSGGAAVHILDLVQRTHVQVSGFGAERLHSPVGATWVGERLFVSDAGRHEIIEFAVDGQFQRRFGQDELQRPVGVGYVASRGILYVADGDQHCVRLYRPDGGFVATFGSRGSGPGEFNFPTHLATWGDRLAVADTGNFRVQLLTLDGAFVRSIGRKGDAAGDFALPKGVAFDADGHLYVMDSQFENVQVFDQEGRLLLAFGEEGTRAGEFCLPAGLAMDGLNRLWAADAGGRRLQVFQYLRIPNRGSSEGVGTG